MVVNTISPIVTMLVLFSPALGYTIAAWPVSVWPT